MEPVLFNKVFVNDDEPYQEILQVMPILSDQGGYSHGDHIYLSPYSGDVLFRKKVQQPMKFRLTTDKYCTYCSVQEFSSPIGIAQLPQWMMNKLDLKPGDFIRLESVSLPKAKKVSVRILDKGLLLAENIKDIFEQQLTKHVVLAEGDRVPILCNGDSYQIEIVKCEPACAVDINNTNVEIDFVPMEEEEERSEEESETSNFKGVGHSLAGANESAKTAREKRLEYLGRKWAV